MRALLIHNPNATTTTPAVTDVIARALSAELKLDVEATKRRDHASFLAAAAVDDGYEVVLALGGDGTANEVLQGLAGTGARLAVIPGGSTNVWARSLGLPNDAVEATSVLLRLLRNRCERVVNLGTANGRYFGFTAGYGYDAEVVRYVEHRFRLKRAVRQASFLYCAAAAYAAGARGRRWARVEISTTVDGHPTPDTLRSAVCCNSNPWTFLGPWPAQLCPGADLDKRLDVTGFTRLNPMSIARVARTTLTSAGVGRLRSVRTWHDHAAYDLRSDTPLALQVDGDFVGETAAVALRSVPDALAVVA